MAQAAQDHDVNRDVERNDHASKHELDAVGETGRIDEGKQVVLDEAFAVSARTRAHAKRVFEEGQRTDAAGRFDEKAPRRRGQLDERYPPPAQREQGTERRKKDEREMRDKHGIGGEPGDHAPRRRRSASSCSVARMLVSTPLRFGLTSSARFQ